MPDDLEIRLLRYFVVVAEELHFSRAAQKLFVAQQALSRDIQRLEERAGVRLLDRTTRRVTLTPAGLTLLDRARQLLALHDSTVRELRGEGRSLTVDVVGPGLTPSLVLAEARRLAPGIEFFARFHTGGEAAVPHLLAERLDVSFGRVTETYAELEGREVRREPLAVLLPAEHPLAELDAVPLAQLHSAGVCFRAGDHVTPGWEHAVLQLLAPFGVEVGGAHPHVLGADELAKHLHDRNAPILALSTQPEVPGSVLRPVVDPVPLYPWAMHWRRNSDHPGLIALHAAVDRLAAANSWLGGPADAWLPRPEADG
ncbi:transcriptional regulator, LysR family [Kribbella flavida DSM 17836]|uniref:Transcriptional regulator, LysR family n=1 Tax=Kribbella flavida (strain DSM 17836 / JCM 10339 / NBRC 14399) TaxID=479435 RepID=D2Q2V2_KRIFD|nr:LysR family transcriptional regulator [Kribbella flavida]ADB30283.1 transcriptional regulator, LysR family [Kribbella flavida DSM 17836]